MACKLIIFLLLSQAVFVDAATEKCSCIKPGILIIHGTVRANGSLVSGAEIRVGGILKTTTDANGRFWFQLATTLRVAVRIEVNPSTLLVSVTKVVNVPDNYSGSVELDVALVKSVVTTVDDPSVETVVPFNLLPSGFSMTFPANTFSSPGVKIYTAVWDTRKTGDALLVPGDFSIQGDDTMALFSAGMLCMSFIDAQGKPVVPKQGCKATIANIADVINPFDSASLPILWGLNGETGRWEINAQFERENAPQVGSTNAPNATNAPAERLGATVVIRPNIRDLNIDWRFDRCWMKVQAFINTLYQINVAGVNVKVVQYVGGVWRFSNQAYTASNGVCINVLCCKRTNGRDCDQLPSLNTRITAIKVNNQYKADTNAPNNFNANAYIVNPNTQINADVKGPLGPVLATIDECKRYQGAPFRFHPSLDGITGPK